MKYKPSPDQQLSGAVADLNELCSTVFDMDSTITTIEICADKSRCIFNCLNDEHLDKRAESLTDFDKKLFIHSYKTMQVKADILSDYLFEIEKAVKELNTLYTKATSFFQSLDKEPAAIEYKSHTA